MFRSGDSSEKNDRLGMSAGWECERCRETESNRERRAKEREADKKGP